MTVGAEVYQTRIDGGSDARTLPVISGTSWESEASPEAQDVGPETDAGTVEQPSPRSSDLLTEFLPFDRRSLENAIDRFLDQFATLGAELTDLREPANLLPVLAVAALTAVATEVALRRRRARAGVKRMPKEDAEGDLAGFAGFPNLWSLGEL
jgi:hypothetical protein